MLCMLTTLCICTGAVVAWAEVACCFDACRSPLIEVALCVAAGWEKRREAFGHASELIVTAAPGAVALFVGHWAVRNPGICLAVEAAHLASQRWQMHPWTRNLERSLCWLSVKGRSAAALQEWRIVPYRVQHVPLVHRGVATSRRVRTSLGTL